MRALREFSDFGSDEFILHGENSTVSIKPNYSTTEVLRMLGGSDENGLSARLRRKISVWADRVDKIINPRLLFSIKPVASVSKTGVNLFDGTSWRSPKLAKAFHSSTGVVMYVGTIGFRIEKEIKKLTNRNRLSEAYIVESLGSVAIENMVEQFHTQYGSYLKLIDKGATLPFSPGYCDWNVVEQKKLFSSIAAEEIGVSINKSGLMTPRKSISGVFGVMDRPSPPVVYNPCANCANRGCSYRRESHQRRKHSLQNLTT